MKMILVPAVPFIQSSIGLFPPIGSIAIGSTLKKMDSMYSLSMSP